MNGRSLILLAAEVPREGGRKGTAADDDDWVGGARPGREEREEEEAIFGVLLGFSELSERRLEISCDCVCVCAR